MLQMPWQSGSGCGLWQEWILMAVESIFSISVCASVFLLSFDSVPVSFLSVFSPLLFASALSHSFISVSMLWESGWPRVCGYIAGAFLFLCGYRSHGHNLKLLPQRLIPKIIKVKTSDLISPIFCMRIHSCHSPQPPLKRISKIGSGRLLKR